MDDYICICGSGTEYFFLLLFCLPFSPFFCIFMAGLGGSLLSYFQFSVNIFFLPLGYVPIYNGQFIFISLVVSVYLSVDDYHG